MTHKLTRLARAGMVACLLGTGIFTTAYAQSFTYPSIPQNGLSPTPYGMGTINSAMMECPDYGSTLAAVVVSDLAGASLYLDFGNGAATSGPVPVTQAAWALADVTIGDDPNMPGQQYVVAVSYREITATPGVYNIMVQSYTVANLGGPMNVTVNPAGPVLIGTGDLPKIDVFADEGVAPVGPFPTMNKVVVAYKDAGNTIQLDLRDMDLNPLLTYAITTGPTTFINAIDAAAIVERPSGEMTVCVSALSNSNSDLEVYECNLSTMTTPPPTLLQSGLMAYYTRIEGFGIYEAGNGIAKWAVTTSDNLHKIQLYTDLTPPYTTNPQLYFLGSTQEYPALASGIGPVAGPAGNLGNSQYTYAWGAPLFNEYYSQSLDLGGNPMSGSNFLVVNNTPCNMVSDPPELITVSNASNSGTNLFVAWNEGSRIMYKQTDNGFGYRPTGTSNVKSFATLTVSPNPAGNKVMVRTTEDISNLTLMNSVGALVLRQAAKTGETAVDVSGIAAGTYFLHITGKNGTTTKPLVIAR